MEKDLKDIYLELGLKIKARRNDLLLSQKQVGDLASPPIDRSKISDIENGKEDFTFSTLLRLCKALDLNMKDLF